jgi:hypothetical protein
MVTVKQNIATLNANRPPVRGPGGGG